MCYRYAVGAGQKNIATGIRKWSKRLTDFPKPKFVTIDWIQQWRMILMDIYSHLCLMVPSHHNDYVLVASKSVRQALDKRLTNVRQTFA